MNWRVVLAVLTCSTVLMSASYTMLIPFLPMYLIQELGVQTAEVNWWSSIIFAVSFLISGIFAPIWGAMSDKGSRKLMALRAASCLAITYFLGSIVQTPWQLFGVRVLQGLAAGLWPRLYRIPIAGDCQERKSLLRTRGRLFAIGENRKPGKTRAAEKRRRFFIFVLAAVFLPVTLPPAARGAKGRPARSPGGRDNRRGHAGSCHCGRRPASPQRRPRRRDHG